MTNPFFFVFSPPPSSSFACIGKRVNCATASLQSQQPWRQQPRRVFSSDSSFRFSYAFWLLLLLLFSPRNEREDKSITLERKRGEEGTNHHRHHNKERREGKSRRTRNANANVNAKRKGRRKTKGGKKRSQEIIHRERETDTDREREREREGREGERSSKERKGTTLTNSIASAGDSAKGKTRSERDRGGKRGTCPPTVYSCAEGLVLSTIATKGGHCSPKRQEPRVKGEAARGSGEGKE